MHNITKGSFSSLSWHTEAVNSGKPLARELSLSAMVLAAHDEQREEESDGKENE